MDLKDILKLIDRLETSSVTHVSVEEEGKKVIIEKQAEVVQSAPVPTITQYEVPQQVVTTNVQETAILEVEEEANIAYITSPIVGTFYESPSPTAGPFVKIGDSIDKGQVLCIVEAMKLMNEIESDFSGEIVEIMVNNEEMVEFGQKLFKVRVK
ncbi:acetyl-CoA carboxylase biotin carboxyl carrier protein [endosymbiont 'TC1' of Trimyema compressum]|uniref:acetyl-CoA carboxylase biotin carboxyl carrier protein n=1 Tax=endosymbiont 'TC1' of Trimyema compressum TaxID=243899 RepID=UPI000A74C3BE|nr:acetyl-CoA carboxylase biotin carboxyl carrier protein [endosymbiont 'TC1' of Trimyema compressum]